MLSSEVRSRAGHPPSCLSPPTPTRRGRADLGAFLGDMWADGHDLVVEDVVLFYLAVDQRQVSPEALAT